MRQNALPALIAAALLIYFGYNVDFSQGDGAFYVGDKISIHTLRIGGYAMAVIAAASLSGFAGVLLADAVCSVLIGAAMALAGALMMAGGGTGFLYLIFGAMFIIGGLRNARDAAQLRTCATVRTATVKERSTSPPPAPLKITSVKQLTRPTHINPPALESPDRPQVVPTPELPPEGFLASFAPKREQDKPNA